MSEGDDTITNEPAGQQPTSAEQQPKESRKIVTDLAPWADSLSKSVATIAIVVYASGFLIVSLHHSRYGFVGTNPFRPRVLAAGAWFLFLSVIPIAAAIAYREWSWSKIAQNFLWCYCVSIALSAPFAYLLFDINYVTTPTPLLTWVVGIPAFIWLMGVIIMVVLRAVGSQQNRSSLLDVVTVAPVLIFVAYDVQEMMFGSFEQGAVRIWFFGVFVVTIALFKVFSKIKLAEGGQWSRPLATMFMALLLFARYYYPHMKASWGGGAPVSVTIYFTKDSAISPNKAVSAQLIEESDEGFYIVGPKETKAIYVPRSAVALVYFSDRTADSPLLRDSK
jgi:hypothetical protein